MILLLGFRVRHRHAIDAAPTRGRETTWRGLRHQSTFKIEDAQRRDSLFGYYYLIADAHWLVRMDATFMAIGPMAIATDNGNAPVGHPLAVHILENIALRNNSSALNISLVHIIHSVYFTEFHDTPPLMDNLCQSHHLVIPTLFLCVFIIPWKTPFLSITV